MDSWAARLALQVVICVCGVCACVSIVRVFCVSEAYLKLYFGPLSPAKQLDRKRKNYQKIFSMSALCNKQNLVGQKGSSLQFLRLLEFELFPSCRLSA